MPIPALFSYRTLLRGRNLICNDSIPFKETPRSNKGSRQYPAFAALFVMASVIAGCQATPNNPSVAVEASVQQKQLQLPVSAASRVAPEASIDSDEFVNALYSFAQQEVGDHFGLSLEDVNLKLADNSELEFFVRRETVNLSHAVFHNQRFAEFFVNKVMQDQAGTYAGLYVSPENRVILNRDLLTVFRDILKADAAAASAMQQRELVGQSLLALLIHELVHAADNKRFQIHARRSLNFRSSVAQSAVFEGHAQLATREICSKLNCLNGLQRLDAFMFEAPEPADPVARSLQAVSRNVLEYAYVEGERFLQALKRSPNGTQRLESALRNPPEDPVQILDPDNFPDIERVNRNRTIFQKLQNVEHKWNSPQYALIETSPIKGLDIRNDPERRAATKEGFTQLIRSMVGAQLFDQQASKILPIEITVMQTENADTADLFANSFQQKASRSSADSTTSANTLHLTIGNSDSTWPMRVFLAVTEFNKEEDKGKHYVSLIANAENWIIQMGGIADPRDPGMISFSEKAMLELLDTDSYTRASR